MKKLFILCAFFLSSYVVADHHHYHFNFKGSGSWTKSNGETGEYKVKIHGAHDNGLLKLNQTYSHGDKSWALSYTLKKKAHGFFDVMKAGEKIGNGYCVKGKKGKTCHTHYEFKGHNVESTIHMMGNRAYRMGSVVGPKGGMIKFSDRLRKENKKKKK